MRLKLRLRNSSWLKFRMEVVGVYLRVGPYVIIFPIWRELIQAGRSFEVSNFFGDLKVEFL